jgi:hypothetical protein
METLEDNMLKQTDRRSRSWWVLAGVFVVIACGGDDGPGAVPEPDGGLHCDPANGGVGTCYCTPSGTQGVHYCSMTSQQWSACMCNEPDPIVPCPPGSFQECTCPDGTASSRMCRASNTFDPCMCDGHLLMDAGNGDAN